MATRLKQDDYVCKSRGNEELSNSDHSIGLKSRNVPNSSLNSFKPKQSSIYEMFEYKEKEQIMKVRKARTVETPEMIQMRC